MYVSLMFIIETAILHMQVQLCLVINKGDRLILELQLQPQEAYERIKGIITQVNMIVSAFESESFMSEADAVLAHENTKANADAGYTALLMTQCCSPAPPCYLYLYLQYWHRICQIHNCAKAPCITC